jgi:NodT family efflux transporter outer membrane factor (OMF) lipoprotein
MKTVFGFTILALFAVGCFRVGPEYRMPETGMPDSWTLASDATFDETSPVLEEWWQVFDDEFLTELMKRADFNNIPLKQALARIEEARAIIQVANAGYFLKVNSLGTAEKIRASGGFPIPTLSGKNIYHRLSLSILDASWELDFWGKVTSEVESATAHWQATIDDYHDALVTLYAEVAFTYYNIRTFQQLITNAKLNVDNQKQSLFLAQKKYEAELTSELDVAQAQLNLSTTESAVPKNEALLAASINSLSVLIGEFPGPLQEEFARIQSLPEARPLIPVSIPANLLRQRPDIRAAEREYAAEFSFIGAVMADLYPQFNLTGMLGYLGEVDIFEISKNMWEYGIGYVWNLFDAGRIAGNIEAQIARAWQAKYVYEQTVLQAVEEVETAMTAYVKELERMEKLRESVVAAQKSVDLVNYQYRVGLTGFFVVLVMQQSLFDQQELLIESEGLVVQHLIEIYKSLGGGWKIE